MSIVARIGVAWEAFGWIAHSDYHVNYNRNQPTTQHQTAARTMVLPLPDADLNAPESTYHGARAGVSHRSIVSITHFLRVIGHVSTLAERGMARPGGGPRMSTPPGGSPRMNSRPRGGNTLKRVGRYCDPSDFVRRPGSRGIHSIHCFHYTLSPTVKSVHSYVPKRHRVGRIGGGESSPTNQLFPLHIFSG